MNGISVIIPVVDEQEFIGSAILQFSRDLVEVIVVDGGSKDHTIQVGKNAGAIVIECPIRSRAAQMNLGARNAKYEILFFVHADVKVPTTFYEDIQNSITKGNACGCYRSGFENYPGLMRINSFMTRFNLLTFRGGDQTLFITKNIFEKLNGFDEYFTIMEDYNIIKRIWNANIPFELIQKDVIISTRKYQNNSWLRVQIANGMAMFLFNRGKKPDEIKRSYRKLLNYKSENYQ